MNRIVSNFLKLLPLLSVSAFKKINLSDAYHSNQQIETSIQRLYLSPLDFSLSQFKVFSLDSGQLGKQVAAHLDISLGGLFSDKFNDGECNIQVLDSIRGHSVYVIKSFGERKINDGIIQLLITVNTLKKQGAENVTCIIPFIPYSQSVDFRLEEDKTFFTCFGSDILKLLQESGCDRVITFNSLMPYPKGFVNSCTFMNINAPDLFLGHLVTKQLKDPILVGTYINTPNVNNLHILKQSMGQMNFDCPISIFNDDQYIGQDVKGRDAILYSNVMRTGNTFIDLSKKLKQMGARNIYGCAFHNLGGQKQTQKLIRQSYFKEFLTTNSLPQPQKHPHKRVKTITLSRLIAQTITLFEQQKSLNDYRHQLQKKKMDAVKEIKSLNKKSQGQTNGMATEDKDIVVQIKRLQNSLVRLYGMIMQAIRYILPKALSFLPINQ